MVLQHIHGAHKAVAAPFRQIFKGKKTVMTRCTWLTSERAGETEAAGLDYETGC